MPARQHETKQEKFTPRNAVKQLDTPSLTDLLIMAPKILDKFSNSAIIAKHGVTWGEYKPCIIDGVGYIRRETCERCGNVVLPPGQRRLREIPTELGSVYLDTGICKDCINASIYVDKFLDGDPLSETEAKNLFYKYAADYEKQWRITLAVAPRIAMTKEEWQHRCQFFGGCALCGGYIEVQHKYFPATLNGIYTPWNIIPLCRECAQRYRLVGKRSDPAKAPRLYKVFASRTYFQRTKTIRLFLLAQMEFHGLYMSNLAEYRQRFFEKKILPGSLPFTFKDVELEEECIKLCRANGLNIMDVATVIERLKKYAYPQEEILNGLVTHEAFEGLKLLSLSLDLHNRGEIDVKK